MIKSFEREKMKLDEAEAYLKALYFEAILKIKFKTEVQYAYDVSSVLNEYTDLTGEKIEQVIVSGMGVLKSIPITQAKALYDQEN